MAKFKTIEVFGRTHVLRSVNRLGVMANPDYKHTGMALCGILKPNQTLDTFVLTYKTRKKSKSTNHEKVQASYEPVE